MFCLKPQIICNSIIKEVNMYIYIFMAMGYSDFDSESNMWTKNK